MIVRNSIFLVFEYCEADIANLIDHLLSRNDYLSLAEIKSIFLQILRGVSYLHQNNILHRDLKFTNILINSHGDIKLADFGLARKIGHPLTPYTPKVVTLWYRAPEILLRSEYYSKPSDAWYLILIKRIGRWAAFSRSCSITAIPSSQYE